MNAEKPIRFALVGCGRISYKHAGLLAEGQVKGGELAAVCDVVPERAQETGQKYNVPYFKDMHEMMSAVSDDIDAVSILTESGLHARHCLELAPYGKHIVVEKPVALTVEDADAMISACDSEGIQLFVVKQNRYNIPVLRLREAFDAGRFGKIVMGTVRVRWSRSQAYYDQADWRGTWAMDGGVFSNQASHHIDLLEWFLGAPVSVFAYSRTALVDIEAEDTGVAVLRFKSGALGIVEATTAARPKDLEGSISILGEKGTVEIGGFAVNELKTWNFSDYREEDKEVMEHSRESPPNVYGFGHGRYLDHVVDCIRSGAPALVDGLEGRKSLELISAIYESIETGREVNLRFQAKQAKLGQKRSL